MRIHIKIGSALRDKLPQFPRGEGILDLPAAKETPSRPELRGLPEADAVPRGDSPQGGQDAEPAAAETVTVAEALALLGLSEPDVNLIYRNHELVTPSARIRDGDRLGLFPPNFIHFSQFYLKRKQE